MSESDPIGELFRPEGKQRTCQRSGCSEDARHYSPLFMEPRVPGGWAVTNDSGWSFLCGKHYDALIDREWDE